MSIHLTDADTTIILDEYKLIPIKNVSSYSFCQKTFNTWIVEVNSALSDMSSNDIYFIIDQCFNEAFAHWVYESAMYLPLFHRLKHTYPSLKLVLATKKDFKLLFCRYFNIPESDILFQIPPSESNQCIFTSPISNLSYKQTYPIIHTHYQQFFKEFQSISPTNLELVDYLIMPRQSKENYYGDERTIPFHDIFDYFKSNTNKTHRIFHTDTVTNLNDQISQLRQAKTIILTDGSALLVNGMFVQNKTFIIVSLRTQNQAIYHPQLRTILEYIQQINHNQLLYFNTDRDAINYISSHILL